MNRLQAVASLLAITFVSGCAGVATPPTDDDTGAALEPSSSQPKDDGLHLTY
jgi:hypothetical protein